MTSIRTPEVTQTAAGCTGLRAGLAGSLLLLAHAGMPATAQEAGPEATGSSPRTLDTVIVTSQRREQDLQQVPVAVTAISSDFVESRGITSIEGLSTLAPNLKIEQTPGNSTSAQISIRGGVTINPALTWEPTVGIYLDGVYIGKTQGSVFDVADIERIEVLRGPQGTLYGRNTLAGAINIISKAPTGSFGGYAEASLGDYNLRQFRAGVDLEQLGPFRIKLSGMLRSRDGIIEVVDNPVAGVTLAGPASSRELDSVERASGLVAVSFDLSPDISVDYAFDYSTADQKPRFSQIIQVDPGNIFDPASPAYAGGGPFGGQYFGFPLDLYVSQDRQFTASVDGPVFEDMTTSGHSLTATADLGWGELKSITGYRKLEWNDALDLDGSPLPLAHTSRLSDYDSFSQEIQLAGTMDRIDYVAGLYYFTDDGATENPQFFFGGGARFDSRYGFSTDAMAAYGQVDWRLNDRVTLTGGLRYTTEEKSVDRLLTALGAPDIALVPAGTKASETFENLSPTVVISYRPDEDINLYAKYSQGYKSGGFNGEASTPEEVRRPYDAEEVTSWEAGLKSTLAGGTVRVNVAAFLNRHRDMQLSVFTAENAAASDIRNAGEATIRGIELEGTWQPADGLTMSASYAHLDSEYDEFIDAGSDVARNRSFPHAPENTFSLVGDARLWSGRMGTVVLSGDYQYTDAYFTFPYTLIRTDPQNAFNSRADERGLVNARLAWKGIKAGGSELEVSVWAKNLLDKEYLSNFIDFGPGFGGLVNGYFGDPRTVGISLRANW